MFTNNLVSGITKTRVMSGAFAATLMAFSFSSWALNGPACNVPQPGGEAAWAAAQDNAGGHLVQCHIGQGQAWLAQRVNGGQPGCQQTPTASAWLSAQAMWAQVGADIQAFCARQALNQNRFVINTQMNGNGTANVGLGVNNNGAFNIANNSTAITVMQNVNGQWHVLTSYPQ
ncbi:RNase A-like domain-containing protein [Cronobacter dublinensis]|uniref:RNase A-like domain-containing protein n=1 Tax=Cronobacter dublinensis TaxID=413497 RepID=UPI00029C1FC8|nr:RNase A-like domain-containing protein [Cronobacter dublinensis]MDI6439165.1 hypothetical protein [Cronobacter dublinensis]NCH97463.1 hypothetical protein [Cronobacter dublinensis]CCJ83677.1 hypothetical protein BN133_54 [Cronobacter dublinensis 582]